MGKYFTELHNDIVYKWKEDAEQCHKFTLLPQTHLSLIFIDLQPYVRNYLPWILKEK